MPYTAAKPKLAPDRGELQRTIPGWGVDLDWRNRPAVPREQFDPGGTGAHWDFPDRQVERYPRERSTEHAFLTPAFGTVCPPRWLSGALRRYAYTFSEGRLAHWAVLVLADRVDVLESMAASALRGRPDNLIAEYGLKAEVTRHGLRSRVGRGRADTKHLPVDVLLFAGKGLVTVGAVCALGLGLLRAARMVRRMT